jgi:alpha-tubulin suppressor-like RCC1 family protein
MKTKFQSAASLLLLSALAFAACGGGSGGGNGVVPGDIPGTVSRIKAISAGDYHTALLTSEGYLYTWGDDEYYQLGDVSGDLQQLPIKIDAADVHTHWDVVSAGGYHTIAIARKDSDRTLWGWGLNLSGQAGFWYLNTPVMRPHQIGAGTDWESVSAGEYHSAAIKQGGTLWTWGDNSFGKLGFPGASTASPTQVGIYNDWVTVSAGADYTLGIKGAGSLYAWGRNVWGQFGDGTQNNSDTPVLIGSGWKSVSAGNTQSAGIKTDGTLWTWGGYGTYATLGNGTHDGSRIPVQIGTDTDWDTVSVCSYHTMAIKRNGSLWAWGDGTDGQLGNGINDFQSSPVEIQSGTNWSAVSAGWEFTLGVKSGLLYSWGDNGYGQLGIGSYDDKNIPEHVIIY